MPRCHPPLPFLSSLPLPSPSRVQIIEAGMKLPWVVRYMMSFPERVCMRMTIRRNFPNPGDISYLAVPYDREMGRAIEEVGPLKVKSGVITAHPSGDPNRSVIYSLDCMGTTIPEWGLAMLMKSMLKSEIKKRADKFLKSSYYAQLARQ